MRRATEDLNELLIRNTFSAIGLLHSPTANLFPDTPDAEDQMDECRYESMEREPRRSARQRFHARLVKARQRARVLQTRDCDRIAVATESLDPAQARSVQETELTDRDFAFAPSNQAGAIKPTTFRGRNARSARPRCTRIEASSVDRSKNSPSPRGVNLGRQASPGKSQHSVFAFDENSRARPVRDRLQPFAPANFETQNPQ